MSTKLQYVNLNEVAEICDNLRKPINSKERNIRIAGKAMSELYPYYGATGQVGYIDDYITDGEYVLLGEDGAPFLNAFAEKAYIITGKTWVNNHAHILKSYTNNKYLCYYLNSFNYKGYVSGTTRLKLTQASLKQIKVPAFSAEEQERIVARIDELFSQIDSGVETLKKTKEQLKVYRQAVLKGTFPKLTSENKMCLYEVADISSGITKGRKLSGENLIELPYLRVANVQNGFLDLTEVKKIQLKKNEIEKYLLKTGDVLYTEGGDRDKLGRGTVWNSEIENCVHQNHVFKARINNLIAIPEYIAYWSMGFDARNYFYENGKQTVNLASINKTVLSNLQIPIIPIESQKEVVKEIETSLSVCDNIEKTIDKALQESDVLRQSILKKAFEGEL